MAARHVVHESTREAVLRLREGGKSYAALATEMGDLALKATLSSIVRGVDEVGPAMERRVRVLMGLPARPPRQPRQMFPSEKRRQELSAQLAERGITWTRALEIALEVTDKTTPDGGGSNERYRVGR